MGVTEEIFKGGLFKPSIKQGNVRALQVVTLRMDDVEILGQRIKSRKTVSLTRLVPSLLPKNITVVWKILFFIKPLPWQVYGRAAVSPISQLPLNTQHKFHPQVVTNRTMLVTIQGAAPLQFLYNYVTSILFSLQIFNVKNVCLYSK